MSNDSTHSGSNEKAIPICQDVSLKEIALSTEALSKLTFDDSILTTLTTLSSPSLNPEAASLIRRPSQPHALPVSSSSSTCTRESDHSSDAETQHHQLVVNSISNCATAAYSAQGGRASVRSSGITSTPKLDRDVSDRLNAKVSLQKESRQGRSSQRWLTDPETSEAVRLVTGCVPILKGGKILCVSSRRKPDWILPKGGWELDEPMEESAVRECFEEAGVLGVLGPRLHDIQYETRKAKKRRLGQQQQEDSSTPPPDNEKEMQNTTNENPKQPLASSTIQAPPLPEQSGTSNGDKNNSDDNNKETRLSVDTVAAAAAASPISQEDMTRIRGHQYQRSNSSSAQQQLMNDNVSVASTTPSVTQPYSQVRLTLFPLYVSKVHDDWPESGRFRTAVDIDEAIGMMEERPEFKAALQEVKERGLHLIASKPRRS